MSVLQLHVAGSSSGQARGQEPGHGEEVDGCSFFNPRVTVKLIEAVAAVEVMP
jgi:hypothetical protein